MDIERLRALEKEWREEERQQLAESRRHASEGNDETVQAFCNGKAFGLNAAAQRIATLIAELGQGVGAVACPKCGGKGYTDEGDPEMGSAIMDCYECWPAPVGATLADAAGDSALTLEAARELLAGAARGIARGEYSPAHTSEARDAARYRWLRDKGDSAYIEWGGEHSNSAHGGELDTAIDAAMRQEGGSRE